MTLLLLVRILTLSSLPPPCRQHLLRLHLLRLYCHRRRKLVEQAAAAAAEAAGTMTMCVPSVVAIIRLTVV